MIYFLGFVISVAIGMTGVGAGTLTTPMLILVIGVPARIAVGTALIFGAVIKIITSPVYMARRQVDWRTLGFMLVGGVPGVLGGVLLLRNIDGRAITASSARRSSSLHCSTSCVPCRKPAVTGRAGCH